MSAKGIYIVCHVKKGFISSCVPYDCLEEATKNFNEMNKDFNFLNDHLWLVDGDGALMDEAGTEWDDGEPTITSNGEVHIMAKQILLPTNDTNFTYVDNTKDGVWYMDKVCPGGRKYYGTECTECGTPHKDHEIYINNDTDQCLCKDCIVIITRKDVIDAWRTINEPDGCNYSDREELTPAHLLFHELESAAIKYELKGYAIGINRPNRRWEGYLSWHNYATKRIAQPCIIQLVHSENNNANDWKERAKTHILNEFIDIKEALGAYQ